jgi:IS605 OrfB family transposase
MLENTPSQYIIQTLQDMFPLNWRYCEHAVRDAEAQIQSLRGLLPLYLKDVEERIGELEKRVERAKSEEKRRVLERELTKLKKKREFYAKHIENGTVPKTVFGGRGKLGELMRGRLSKEGWREVRNNQLYSIGQANQKGNANLRIIRCEEGRYGLNVRFPTRREVKVGKDGRRMRYKGQVKTFSLYVPAKFQQYLEWALNSGMAYSICIIKGGGRYLVYISFNIGNAPLPAVPERVTAIDANPEGFAAAVVSRDGNLLAHRFFRDDRLIYASKEKRNNIIGVLVSRIVGFAEEHHATTFVIEDLNIRNHADFGRKVNRIVYAFVRRKFEENLLTKCWKNRHPMFTVNPAYTSALGEIKYAKLYGLSPHEAAALVIGRRFYGYGERLTKPIRVKVRGADGRKAEIPVQYVWPSIHGYQGPADPYRAATDGRKGGGEQRLGPDNEAAFTGHPAEHSALPMSVRGDWARKGGECGGNPQATGNGGKPAPTLGVDGQFEAKSLCIINAT